MRQIFTKLASTMRCVTEINSHFGVTRSKVRGQGHAGNNTVWTETYTIGLLDGLTSSYGLITSAIKLAIKRTIKLKT